MPKPWDLGLRHNGRPTVRADLLERTLDIVGRDVWDERAGGLVFVHLGEGPTDAGLLGGELHVIYALLNLNPPAEDFAVKLDGGCRIPGRGLEVIFRLRCHFSSY